MRAYLDERCGEGNVEAAFEAGRVLAAMPAEEAWALVVLGRAHDVLKAIAKGEPVPEPEVVAAAEPEVAPEPVAAVAPEPEVEPVPEAVEVVNPGPELAPEIVEGMSETVGPAQDAIEVLELEEEAAPEEPEEEADPDEPRFIADTDFSAAVKEVLAKAGFQTAEDLLARAEELEPLDRIGPKTKAKLLAWAAE